jgi:hypothetical protein
MTKMKFIHVTKFGLSMICLRVLSGCSTAPDAANEQVGASEQAATQTFRLNAVSSGNWNSAGIHTVGNYQIGHSTEHPDQQAAYFEFNLDPIKGRTLVSASILIPGSTDYNIEVTYPPKCPGTNVPCFKVGIAPQGALTTSEIVNPSSNNNNNIFRQANDGNANQDLGYAWVENGVHQGLAFSADHYNNARLQNEINAGGHWVFWSRDVFDTGEKNMSNGACPACPGGVENYIWGNTAFTSAIQLIIAVK